MPVLLRVRFQAQLVLTSSNIGSQFYKHELLAKYEWYWRLEPEIKFFCDITYDPFIHMIRNKKTYGFTIAVKELRETVPNIWRYASAYKRNNNLTSKGMWEMFVEKPEKKDEELKTEPKKKNFFPQDIMDTEFGTEAMPDIHPENMEGESYNMCHFWSNFEIANLNWFRSKEYNDFFELMDRSGGFWMERWGAIPREDNTRREGATGRRQVLGTIRPRQREWRRLSLQMRHGHCRRGRQRRVLSYRVGGSCRWLGVARTRWTMISSRVVLYQLRAIILRER